MILQTLGGLELSGSDFSQPKPLLLLAYLALEGPTPRRHAAELFWPKGNRMKSLSMALTFLRQGAPGSVGADDVRIWTTVQTDAHKLLGALERRALEEATRGYRGPFLEGVLLRDWSVELEEWVYSTRERLAEGVREAMLLLAEREAAGGQFGAAARRAERAFRLAGAPALEPGELERLYTLLLAADSPQAKPVRRELDTFGVAPELSAEAAKAKLRQSIRPYKPVPTNVSARSGFFVGRDRELEELTRCLADPTCSLLTLVGPAGVGKTRLALETARRELGGKTFPDGVYFVSLAPVTDPVGVASSLARVLGIKEHPSRPTLERLKETLEDKELLLILDNLEQVIAAAPMLAELLGACAKLKLLVTSRVPLHVYLEQEVPVAPLAVPEAGGPLEFETLDQVPAVSLFLRRAQAARPNFGLTSENAEAVAAICRHLEGLPLALELAAARIKLFPPQAMLAKLDDRLNLLTSGFRDSPARHQTLRRAVAWSYELLEEDEQALFRRLAVFVGGFTLEAAQHLGNAASELSLNAADGVAALLDKSLLQQDVPSQHELRYAMLETIRAYGLECLGQSGEDEVTRRAHATYYLALAEQAEAALTGPEQGVWLERLEADHDNLRAALSWAVAQTDADLALRLGAALWRFWIVRGHMREGRARLETLLALPQAHDWTSVRAEVLSGLGTLVHEIGDYPLARPLFEESLAIWRELENEPGIAGTLNNLGWVATQLSDFKTGRTLSEEALSLNRKLGERRGTALALNNLGWLEHYLGNFSRARALHGASLEVRRELQDERGCAFALTNLAWATLRQGDVQGATRLLNEALAVLGPLGDLQLMAWARTIQGRVSHDQGELEEARAKFEACLIQWREVGNRYGLGVTLRDLAHVLVDEGQCGPAATSLGEAMSLFAESGNAWCRAYGIFTRGHLAQTQADFEGAARHYRESLKLRHRLGDRWGVAECLEGCAHLAVCLSEFTRAATLLAAAETLRSGIVAPRPRRCQAAYERSVATLRTRLDDATFEQTWLEGSKMSPEKAVTFESGDL